MLTFNSLCDLDLAIIRYKSHFKIFTHLSKFYVLSINGNDLLKNRPTTYILNKIINDT